MKQNTKCKVIVIDNFVLRRASLTALVQQWTCETGAEVVAISPADLDILELDCEVTKLVILSTGGASLRDGPAGQWAVAVARRFPSVPCIVLSDRVEPEEAIRAAQLGKHGFMSTSVDPEVAMQAFSFVSCGGTYFPREALLQGPKAVPAEITVASELTPRQEQVLERLRQGSSNKHIARQLDVQESTVKVHVREIMRKLAVNNRTEAAMLSRRPRPAPEPVTSWLRSAESYVRHFDEEEPAAAR